MESGKIPKMEHEGVAPSLTTDLSVPWYSLCLLQAKSHPRRSTHKLPGACGTVRIPKSLQEDLS